MSIPSIPNSRIETGACPYADFASIVIPTQVYLCRDSDT